MLIETGVDSCCSALFLTRDFTTRFSLFSSLISVLRQREFPDWRKNLPWFLPKRVLVGRYSYRITRPAAALFDSCASAWRAVHSAPVVTLFQTLLKFDVRPDGLTN
jgi:hypothetical protein